MATPVCLTCIKSIGSDEPLLTISKNQEVQDALNKHFWFAEDQCIKSSICQPCWQKIDEFHRFYCEVEQLHAQQTVPPIHLLEIKQEGNLHTQFTPELEELDRLDTDDTKAKVEDKKETSDRQSDDGDKVVEVHDDDKDVEDHDDDDDDDDDEYKPDNDDDDDDDEYKPDNDSSEHEPSEDDDNDSGSKPKRRKVGKCDIEKIREYIRKNIQLECTACSKTTETFEELQRHTTMEHETRAHVFCCEKKFIDLYRLNDHVQYHLNPEAFKCPHCSKPYPNKDQLRGHIIKFHIPDEEKKYRCKKCPKRFTKATSLAVHEKNHARKDGTAADEEHKASKQRHVNRMKRDMNNERMIAKHINLECDSCHKKFDTFLVLQKHSLAEHQKLTYVFCCGQKFNKKPRLVDHVRYHLDPAAFQCKVCSKKLPHGESLKRHMDSSHTPEEAKTLQCSMCPKMFSHQKFLTTHERYHNRSWLCKICDKRFICEAILKQHHRSIHTKELNYVCHICAKTFHIYSTYRSHLQTHGEIPKKKPKQARPCPVCGNMTYNLPSHIRQHSGTKTCEVCGQVCKNLISYTYHMKRHEIGDYICSVCGKGFKRDITLKEHMASHTGEVLYSCDFCERTFNSNANRASHRKKMHPQQWLEDKLKKQEARQQARLSA